MTKITVRYSDTGEFVSLHSVGHANSGDYGKDIVCAAISAVILGGINALEGQNYKLKADEQKGEIELYNIGNMTEHDQIVIETVVAQLSSIARDNPKHLKISVE